MTTVSLKEAKSRLAELARKVEAGETVTITRNGRPVVDMVPSETAPKPKSGIDWEAGRKFLESQGIAPGNFFTYIASDFDDPLPEDFLITPEADLPAKG